MQDSYSLERIADRMAIQDLMYRWCRSVDRLDFELMRSLFHPDAIDDHGAFKGDVEGSSPGYGNGTAPSRSPRIGWATC